LSKPNQTKDGHVVTKSDSKGFLWVLRFPPTRRPSEHKHRCQRAWL